MGSRTLDIGSTKQIFIDDSVVAASSNVQRQPHRPVRHGPPILEADRPWETDGGGVYMYGGSVLFDSEERVFKMWYRASGPISRRPSAPGSEDPGGYRACYAVSDDGVEWHKPDLGAADFGGDTRNNLLPPSGDGMQFIRRPNLIKDYDEPDPARRYKMVYMDYVDGAWGLSKAYSPDGIRWEMNVGTPHRFERGIAPNGILFGWDPRFERYVHFHRKQARIRSDVDGRTSRRKTAVMRTESRDFETWGGTTEALAREPGDPPNWSPSHGIDLAAVLYTDDLYAGFIDTVYSHMVEDVDSALWGIHGSEFAEYRTELVVSRDGLTWRRAIPFFEFMRSGMYDAWDCDHVALHKPLVKDDLIYIYYSGGSVANSANDPHHPQHHWGRREAIGVATMRLDGFVSLDGCGPDSSVTTRPLRFEGDRLEVNVRAPLEAADGSQSSGRPHGRFAVEVLDINSTPLPGYSKQDCDVFSGDEARLVVTWNGGPYLRGLAGLPVRLRFHLDNAALYAFRFRGEREPAPAANPWEPGSRGFP